MKIESSIEELNKIVEKLEDENISIDNAIKLFEDGVKLIKSVKEELSTANAKVNVLKKQLDEYTEENFDTDTDI